MKSKNNKENSVKIDEVVLDSTPESNEDKIPVIGQFKPKRKFLNFVTGLKGRIMLFLKVKNYQEC